MTLPCRQGSRRHRDSSPSMRDVTRFHLFVRRRRLRRPPQESAPPLSTEMRKAKPLSK
ncbi:hypothetical protein EE612_029050 [Oryza sativa]|nr:hypothetical protein EE612_029050 [Oryza sativa]